MCGKDVEDGSKDIQCDSDCMLCLHVQCACLTDNVYEVLANLNSSWKRKSCRKTKAASYTEGMNYILLTFAYWHTASSVPTARGLVSVGCHILTNDALNFIQILFENVLSSSVTCFISQWFTVYFLQLEVIWGRNF